MTIRFAAAWGGTTPAISRSLCLGAPLGASNDNPPCPRRLALHAVPNAPEAELDQTLAAALMHFARHGLSAASQARDEAVAAHASGDIEASARWLEICRRLDRRMAQAAQDRLGT
ncbi:MAG TPA: hypothetical protein VMQ93_06695 [Novosphingobium sp.]|nr:hypothetical protein [Novosphingobium sp.]